MEIGLPTYFTIAVIVTFLGAIPFGAINLSVINTTLKKSFIKGLEFSVAASIVEIGEALVAILFGTFIEMFLKEYEWIQIIVFSIFIGLGLYNLIRKTHPKLKERSRFKLPEFAKGLLISLANPQAIPFWIFVLAFLAQSVQLDFMGASLMWFLTGVFVGKLLALVLFGLLSNFLKDRLKKSCTLINRTFGFILLLIGLVQAFQFFT